MIVNNNIALIYISSDYRVDLPDNLKFNEAGLSCVSFDTIDDNEVEGDEKFEVTLSPKGVLVTVNSTAKKAEVIITDNDKS